MNTFKIYITIDGYKGSFVFFNEELTELIADDQESAIELFNKQKRELLRHTCQDNSGNVRLHVDECHSGIVYLTYYKEFRFLLTSRLMLVLNQIGGFE